VGGTGTPLSRQVLASTMSDTPSSRASLFIGVVQTSSYNSDLFIEHFHGAASRVEPAETAYALRADGFNVLVLSQWMSPADDAAGTKWSRDAYAEIRSFGGPSRYLNYFDQDDTGDQALTAAYGPNLLRLQQIKAKYDPENVFHLNVNIPPKA
jgi:hypothetical protein